MIQLIEKNDFFNYQVWHTDVVEKHQQDLIESSLQAEKIFNNRYGAIKNKNLTWSYQSYNIWLLTSPCPAWFELYKDLLEVIKNYKKWDTPVWMESWINLHNSSEFLDWHTHYWPLHGYISIDPLKTATEFEGYEIINRPGQIYLGPGKRLHRVCPRGRIDESELRITVGFDIAYEFIDQRSPLDYQLMPLVF